MVLTAPKISPVARRHINLTGKYEIYIGEHSLNIQKVIRNIIGEFEIDISAASH